MSLKENPVEMAPAELIKERKKAPIVEKEKKDKVDLEATERAMLKAKVAKELAKIKKFRSAFTSENLDVSEWNSEEEE